MIPIFIITCDRLKMLKESIQSYRDNIKTPFEIVICDQGSTFKPTVEFLKKMEADGTKIYWRGNVNAGREKNLPRDNQLINENIQDYFKTHPESNYIVTDPDIALDGVDEDILEAYSYFLNSMPQRRVVGPMLRIDDIPDYYPLKKQVIRGRMHRGFHAKERHVIHYKERDIEYIFARIDTTFGMFRAGTQWRSRRHGIRTFAPYSAKHLDWYVNPRKLSKDQKYYMKRASKNAHWSRWG